VVGIFLLKHVDETLSSRHVNAFAGRVIIQIIRVLDTGERLEHLARQCIENGQSCWFVRANKQPVIGLIQRHWKVVLQR
jgi:hypothetical protein